MTPCMKQKLAKAVAVWVPAITTIELAWLTINTPHPVVRNLWGLATVGSALFGIACQHITKPNTNTHNQTRKSTP